MTAVAVKKPDEETGKRTAWDRFVVSPNGGAPLPVGAHPGNTGGKPGRSGGYNRSALALAARQIFDRFQLLEVAARIAIGDIWEQIDTDKETGEPIYGATKNSDRIRAIEYITNRAWGLPTQAVEVTGAVLTGPITEQERRARIRELLLNALERIEPADVVEGGADGNAR